MRQSCYIYNFCNSHLCRVLPANIARGISLLAVIAAFAVKFSKLLIVGAIGVIYGVKKLFGGRRREEDDE